MSKSVHLIVVGKLKDKNLEQIEASYLKRIQNPKLHIHEVRSKAESLEFEGAEVLKKIKDLSKDSPSYIIALAEFGKEFDSPKLSSWLFSRLESQKNLIFLIAGAEGHSPDVMALCKEKLSLSKLTFPHKIARILFIEQFYRAITIQSNHPYHN